MRSFLPKKIILIFLALVVVGGVGWIVIQNRIKANAQTKKQSQYTVTRAPIQQTLTVSGELRADQFATLRFQTSGLLNWVGVKTGDSVKPYQAIASLDRRELQKRLQKYLLSYQKTRWDFDQTKDEFRDEPYWGLSVDARKKIDRTFDKSQFDLNSSVLDVEIQDIALGLSTLTTPIGGIVTRVDAPNAGINITPASAEFDIVNPDTLYLSVTADQTEVIKLTPGMPATLTLDPFPDDTLSGTISAISFTPKSGETGTVYEVKVGIPNTSSHTRYRLGMTGDATFVLLEKPDVIAIPSNYIKPEGDKKFVMRKNTKNEEVKQYIETGIETDTMTEVTGGLSNGDILYD